MVSLVVNIDGILLFVEYDEKLYLVTLCHSCHLMQVYAGWPKNGPYSKVYMTPVYDDCLSYLMQRIFKYGGIQNTSFASDKELNILIY